VTTLADLSVQEERGVVFVEISGEMDVSNVADVEQRLVEAVPNSALGMVIDLSQLAFVDSAGVELFFRLGKRLEERRQGLSVALPGDAPIHRVFDIVRFGERLPVSDSVEEAGALLRAGGG
jgi:anti-anti-sigma factor